ncbi:glycoside hydrolase [Streptomyces sulfonofaciens]|uniref:Glycoside hydrolase n=1 Tax=Streptomyces sulfonofaciens TaxID=68272 RepID=A0A919G6B5_9ACTN|nr:C40 family peptidase [Streptomyces sulfonofaciens]GHH78785.1 glycoside hydrolase [Streptomyces sulfonofaciens]
MASHRKPRNTSTLTGVRTPAALGPAVGITTAALTSVVLLAPSAGAAPSDPAPNLEEVQKQVDGLYHQAGVATQKYNAAKEHTAAQRKRVDRLLDDVAKRTESLNAARQELGSFAAAQYRTGGISGTATLLLADDPQQYFDDSHLMNRLTDRQKAAVDGFEKEQAATAKKRAEAAKSLTRLTDSQATLRETKEDVQKKLASARTLLSKLTAKEKARLAAIEKQKEEAAARRAQELAARQAAAQREQEQSGSSGTATDHNYAAMATKAIDFAKAQLGKPYVWGATGPDSFDCSGLTQAAWKAAGVSLPRTTWDQVKVGTTVPVDQARPGDLVFYFSDISHVGLYIGDGQVIDAPRPGKNVETIPMTYMPIYSVVRPA